MRAISGLIFEIMSVIFKMYLLSMVSLFPFSTEQTRRIVHWVIYVAVFANIRVMFTIIQLYFEILKQDKIEMKVLTILKTFVEKSMFVHGTTLTLSKTVQSK